MVKAVGFNVELEPTEFVVLAEPAGRGQVRRRSRSAGRAASTRTGISTGFVSTPGTLNDAGYSNARLDYIARTGARKSVTQKARITLYSGRDEDDPARSGRSSTSTTRSTTSAWRRRSTGIKCLRRRADPRPVRRVRHVGESTQTDDRGRLPAPTVGAALIVLFLASMLVFAGVRALPGRSGDRARRREPGPGGARGHPAQVRARRAVARPVRQVGLARAPGRPRASTQRELPVAHTIVDAAADHARARRALDPVRHR